MTRNIILLLILSFFSLAISAQQKDEVSLKNGSIVKGKIIERDSAMVKIETMGGSIFVFSNEEVSEILDVDNEKVKVDEKPYSDARPKYKPIPKPKKTPREFLVEDIRETGIGLSYGKGLLFGNAVEGGPRVAMSYSLINYYQFNFNYKVGIGISFQTYRLPMFPFYGHFEYTVKKDKRSPFFYAQMGGAPPVNGRQDQWWGREPDSKGGLTAEIGLGIKRYVSEKSSIMLSVGYHYQTHKYIRYDWIWDDNSQTSTEIATNVQEIFMRIPVRVTCEF
ncbi:MAG: hypothetical protein MRY83_14725 [Flavobacteriales bacterium]|nr:hypothetical protein [Flavobacteriales bacterium]